MIKKLLTLVIGLVSLNAVAQVSTVSVNKPLGFLNPALQNLNYDRATLSASYVVSPYLQDVPEPNYLFLGEVKLGDNLRLGAMGSKVDNRLNKTTSQKLYASYSIELEEDNYFILGLEAGMFNDQIKTSEFNKVYNPNRFTYPDSIINAFDIGVGFAYKYSGFTMGVGMSKLNGPPVNLFPIPIYEKVIEYGQDSIMNDTSYQLKDTSATVRNLGRFSVQANVNFLYEWDANDDLKLLHSLYFGNFNFSDVDFVSIQNIATYKERYTLGLGTFYNGYWGYNGTLGAEVLEGLNVEASAFFTRDRNWNEDTKVYESDGFKPTIEANLRYTF